MKERDLRDGSLYESVFRYRERRSSARFYCLLLTVLIVAFAFRIYWTGHFGGVLVDGPSMMQTLQNGDELLIKFGNNAERGDVIVVDVRKYRFENNTEFLIKRLIGIEGDELYCENNRVYIKYSGTEEFVLLDEPYAYYTGRCSFASAEDPYSVGKGEIFFLGDNRCVSMDSRYKEDRSHLENCLYKTEDIYGVVPAWTIKHRGVLKWIPGIM